MKRSPTHPELRAALVALDEATAKVKAPAPVDPLSELRAWRLSATRRLMLPTSKVKK